MKQALLLPCIHPLYLSLFLSLSLSLSTRSDTELLRLKRNPYLHKKQTNNFWGVDSHGWLSSMDVLSLRLGFSPSLSSLFLQHTETIVQSYNYNAGLFVFVSIEITEK